MIPLQYGLYTQVHASSHFPFSLVLIVLFPVTQEEMLLVGMSHHRHFHGMPKKGKPPFVPLSIISVAYSRWMPLVLGDYKCHGSIFPGKKSLSHFAWRHLIFPRIEHSAQPHCARGNCICFFSWPPKAKQSFHLRAQAGQLIGELRMS